MANDRYAEDSIGGQAPDSCDEDCPLASRGETELHGSHATFLVRKKPFAYYLDDHQGDGIVGVTCKVLPGENNSLIEAQPERFYPPAYLASRGWVALRLDRGKIDWQEVKELLLGSYTMIAPKRLAEQVFSDL